MACSSAAAMEATRHAVFFQDSFSVALPAPACQSPSLWDRGPCPDTAMPTQ